jgi:hypothetical protein
VWSYGGSTRPVVCGLSTAATPAVLGPPSNLTPPTVTGTPSVGQTLSCSTGIWSNSPTSFGYAWSDDFEPIAGATGATYVVSPSDVGHTLACEVTATNAAGSRQAFAEGGSVEGGPLAGPDELPPPQPAPPGPSGGGNTSSGSGAPGGPAQAGPSPSAVNAALAALTTPKGVPPMIASLLGSGGYTPSFSAPGAGLLTARWTTARAQASQARSVLVASGSHRFGAAGRTSVKLRLSAAGRKLLKRHRTLRVAEIASFTPSCGSAQSKQTTLTIMPGKRAAGHR